MKNFLFDLFLFSLGAGFGVVTMCFMQTAKADSDKAITKNPISLENSRLNPRYTPITAIAISTMDCALDKNQLYKFCPKFIISTVTAWIISIFGLAFRSGAFAFR